MGNAESTLAFKAQFKELNLRCDLSEKDSIWHSVIPTTASHHHVFGVLSTGEIRRLRDAQPQNLETLVSLLVVQLQSMLKPAGVGPTMEEQVLFVLRSLERLLPYIYERPSYARSIHGFLWNNEAVLATLVDCLLKLTQQPGFCVGLQHDQAIWAAGIGAEIVPQPTKQHKYNRIELLRCLVVCLSEPLYNLPPHGLQLLVSKPPAEIAGLFCSLFNSALQQNLSFLSEDTSGPALVLLMILVVYHDGTSTNNFRRLFSKIHLEKDLQLVEARVSQPSDVISASLLLEMCQANQKFSMKNVGYIVDLINLERYNPQQRDLVRLLLLVLVHQSTNSDWCRENSVKLMELYGPFMDAGVHMPALLDLLYNISPYARGGTNFMGFINSVALVNEPGQKQSLAQSLQQLTLEEPLEGDWAPQEHEYSPIEFCWDEASMRWYTSVLWGHAMKVYELRPGVGPFQQTDIQMFKVSTKPQIPSLRDPRGAVDAVGSVVGTAVGSVVENVMGGASGMVRGWFR